MQAPISQDAGKRSQPPWSTHLDAGSAQKLDTDQQSRRRLKRRDTDCRGYALEQPLQSSTTNLQDRRDRTEKLRIYSVALRFQTTDGCSSSFAKRY